MATFPEEIFERICHDICGFRNSGRYETLFNLMLSSRALYRIARPMLYHSMNSRHAFARSLHSFVKRPEMFNLVEESHMRMWQRDHCTKLELDQSLIDFWLLSAGIAYMSWELQRDLEEQLRKGSKQAIICMLLAVCRNLKVLIMGEDGKWKVDLLLRFITETMHVEGPLNHLTMLKTEGWDTFHRSHVRDVLPYWQLPSLRSYRGDCMECINDPFPFPENVSGQPPSQLSHIVLRDSLIDSLGLESILTFCPQLRSLDIEPGDALWTEFIFEWHEFGEVLRRCGTELEYFMLDTVFFYETGEQEPSETVLGNLRDMKKLRSLLLDWISVIGPNNSTAAETILSQPNYLADTLPSSLRELVLNMDEEPRDFPEQQDMQLIELMQSERFENLSLILILKRTTFLQSLPHGWKQSLGGEHMKLEWGITVGTCWQGRVIETKDGLILERT